MTAAEHCEEPDEITATVPIEELVFEAVLDLNHQAYKDIKETYAAVFEGLREGDLDERTVEEYRAALQSGQFLLEEQVEPLVGVERAGRRG